MKIFKENLYSTTQNFIKKLTPFKLEHLDTMNMHTKEPKFQKIECYDIKPNTNTNKTYQFTYVKIEKEDPQMITLTENQKTFLLNYINKTFYNYNQGVIHLDELSIRNFKSVQEAAEATANEGKIRKTSVDFVLSDIKNSYCREGYSDRLIGVDLDDILEYRIK